MAEKKTYCIKTETLARFAKALGHPARIAIMKFLAKQETCYFGDIHEELPIAQATVSQHLKELKDAGLIQGEIETPKVKYCIVRENWEYASDADMAHDRYFPRALTHRCRTGYMTKVILIK